LGFTVANLLTIARMVLVPVFIMLVVSNHPGWALGVFAAAGISDALDGFVARHFGQGSALGAFLDPLADKLLMTAALVVLSLPDHPASFPDFTLLNRFPILLTILTISRDVLIVLIALVIHLATGLTRFPPTILGKITTALQVVTVCAMLLYNTLGIHSTSVVPGLVALALTATILSGLHYIRHAAHLAASAPEAGR
jgi:cardiolipin synthase (CMP-forming)